MKPVEVQAPDGRVWRVRRRWMPRTPKLRPRSKVSTRRQGDTTVDAWTWWPSGDFDFDFDDLIGGVIAVIVLVAVVFLLGTVVFPIVAITLELVLLVLLFTAGIIGRLFFGRPWRIEAETIGEPKQKREVEAKGLRGSRDAVDDLASEIRSGRAGNADRALA